jgi:protein-tyrosine phosphatase
MHSHLLAGLDDGVKSNEEALTIIEKLHGLGYRKLITTPHIMSDYYRNTPETIHGKLNELNEFLRKQGTDMTVEASAEYYLDEEVISKVSRQEKLLTMGDNYLLFETNFFTEPYQLNDFIFNLITQGYKPILAHPERYHYMTLAKAEDLRSRGVYLQLNMTSLADAYGPAVYRMAVKLIEKGWVDFLGSDCHNLDHTEQLRAASQNKYFAKALHLPLLNNSL